MNKKNKKGIKNHQEELIDESIDESFPASDSPTPAINKDKKKAKPSDKSRKKI